MAFAMKDLFARPRELPAREAYALWAESYPARPHNPVMAAEQSIVAPLLCSAGAQAALDLGTGSGRNLPFLRAGARLAVGLDFSMAMLDRRDDGWPRVCGDARCLPFSDARFELISSSLMAGDVNHLDEWLREIARVLKPAGQLVYSDFHPTWAAERWRRTFRGADGALHAIGYFPHSIADHLAALAAAGLVVRAIREPRARIAPLRRFGLSAGRRSDAPVVVVFHAVKPRRRR